MGNNIPYGIMTDILGRVASSSAIDLCNVKLTCKDLNHAADDAHVWKQISTDEAGPVDWKPSAAEFLRRCEEAQNPGALFRLGLYKFFSENAHDEGAELLQRAAFLGHEASGYVFGIISLGHSDEQTRSNGMELLGRLCEQSCRIKREYRKKAEKILQKLWINTHLTPIGEPLPECGECQESKKRGTWSASDDKADEVFCSEACKWNRELHRFCEMLPLW